MTTTIKIQGMSCNHCAGHVKNALLELDGVKSAAVSLEKAQAVIEHDASLSADRLSEAVEEAGYQTE